MILEIDKRADLQQLVKVIGDDRLSFGSAERLMAQLGVTPGSVSPFGLLHDGIGERAGDRRSGSPRGRPADLSPEHQHRERDDLVADLDRFLASRANAVRWVRL